MFKSLFKKFRISSKPKPPKDPVCGMRASEGITFAYKGQSHAFCSEHCRQQFERSPESYIKTQA